MALFPASRCFSRALPKTGGVGPDVGGDGLKLLGALQAEAEGQRQREGFLGPAQRVFYLREEVPCARGWSQSPDTT